MLDKIINKVKSKLGIPHNRWDETSWTPYRIFTFITSSRGQQKLLFFGKKAFFGIIRRITGIDFTSNNNYSKWLKVHYPNKTLLQEQKKQALDFKSKPFFSIILPTYNPNISFLKEAIASVKNQTYTHWELCISDDNSSDSEVKEYLAALNNEPNINVIFNTENQHISLNTNAAISIAKGNFMVFMDHDDTLSPEALFQNALVINNHENAEVIYSDEDKIDEKGKHTNPYFKPDWSPETLLSRNYICHLLVVKSELVKKVNGFRQGFEGAQDYDFLLRITELTQEIYHISKVLYHWRMHQASTALNDNSKSYYKKAGVNALNEALVRRNIKGKAEIKPNLPGLYSIAYEIDQTTDFVSIIIPSKNLADVTNTCITSIFEKSINSNFEVLLMNNNSDEKSFFDLVKYWNAKEPNRFKCITDNGDFNFSRLMNTSVNASKGNYILLLNNDTEVLNGNWMNLMLGWAKQKHIGAVGTKLLFPNDTIQHAGVVMGLNGLAGHFLNCQYKDAPIFWHSLNGVTNYSAVTAACLMVSKEKYEQVGGFNENLAVEFNDVDFCLKLKANGLRNVYIPEIELYHYESISRGHPHKTKESFERHLREVSAFKSKWEKEIAYDPFYNTHLSRVHSDAKLRVKEEVIL